MLFLVLSILLILTAIFTIYFWVDFFFKGHVQVTKEKWYIKFESAFPIADFWMAICALIGAIGFLTGQSFGPFFALLAASSLIFLALMDITFNVQNKMYHRIRKSREMAFELVINVWCLTLGIALILILSTIFL
ncbi:MAG: hypothetical protein ACFFDJ_00405 [Candidatus Odinarchaeota archaeon]